MIIGIDLDEVLFPLLDHHSLFLNKKYSLNLNPRNFSNYNFWEHYNGTKEQAIRDFEEFTSTGEFTKIPPFPGSQNGIRELQEIGELYIITSRTDNIKEETLRWLDEHFKDRFAQIEFGNHFSSNKIFIPKYRLCLEHKIQLMIEDHLTYAKEIVEQGIPVILFDKPWNQTSENLKNIIRARDWKEIVEKTKEYIINPSSLS